jgi:murein L,D-transpeptidase YcbB/YkuD
MSFDSETEKLTKDFQKKNKLIPDGVVGNATLWRRDAAGLKP